jgi:RNA polymerase sigma-70 factor (ECF subfamily)
MVPVPRRLRTDVHSVTRPLRLSSPHVGRIRASVFGWVAAKAHDPDDAEDITQRVMLRVLTHFDTFRGESRLSSWLYRIAANEVASFYRGRWREVHGLDGHAEPDPAYTAHSVQERLDGERLKAAVQDLAATLPPLQQATLRLVDLGHLKPCEAARALGKSEGNVRSSLCRARAKIRGLLRESRLRLVEELVPDTVGGPDTSVA